MKTIFLKMLVRRACLLTLALAAAVTPAVCGAISTYDVTWDTSQLNGGVGGENIFYVYLALTNGGGSNNSTRITVDDLQPASVIRSDPPYALFGGASGDLASGVTLTDADFSNGFVQKFNPSAALRFRLTTDIDPDGGLFPDLFSIGILYGTDLLTLPTEDSEGADAFLRVNLTATPLSFEVFDGRALSDRGNFVPAPVVHSASETPEPQAFLLAGSA